MVKRLISCYASDFEKMDGQDLKKSILASEGRTIMGETVVTAAPLLEGVTNAEAMAAFGADLLCLNEFDVFEKKINGYPDVENPIADMKYLTGRPVGINLEPVDEAGDVLDIKVELSKGRRTSAEAFREAEKLGIDFIMITGNPSTGVTNEGILNAISVGRENYSGLLLAGKMHGAGVQEEIINIDELLAFVDAGADGVLIPAAGTVPGVTLQKAHEATAAVKAKGAIVMATIGTSQESADEETIRRIGLNNKQMGADIHHIGDGAYGRMPLPENITALSLVVRGRRHTFFRMAQSVRR